MKTPAQVSALAASVVLPGAVFLLYTDLNLRQNMFFPRLGCGCNPFPNTNHLSFLVSASTLLLAGLLWWRASGPFPRNWRLGFRSVSIVASLWFLRLFLIYNYWL